jgi:ATP-dependent DNA helicase RecG
MEKFRNLQKYLEQLRLLDDEGERLEFKEYQGGLSDSIWKSIVAFSNTRGGYILAGIRESDKTVLGVSNPDSVQKDIASAIIDKLEPPLAPIFKVIEIDGKRVVEIHILEAEIHQKPVYDKPKGINKGAFKRVGSSNIILSSDDISDFELERRKIPPDSLCLEDITLQELDENLIDNYRNRLRSKKASSPLLGYDNINFLKGLKLAVFRRGKLQINRGCVLLFGKSEIIQEIFPSFKVQIIEINSNDWEFSQNDRGKIINIEGKSILQLIPDVQDILERYTPENLRIIPGKLEREIDPVYITLREAVVNAFIHQDYLANRPTQIRHYNNRLEIENPGTSKKPLDVLIEAGSYPRNPILVKALHNIGWVETIGSGVRTMIDSMKQAGFTPPVFDSDEVKRSFQVVLYWHHFMSEKDRQWVCQFQNLDEPSKRALIFTKAVGRIANADYRNLNNNETLDASRGLAKLRDRGYLEQHNAGNKTYYTLLNKYLIEKSVKETPKKDNINKQLTYTQLDIFTDIHPTYTNTNIENKKRSNSQETRAIILEFCREPHTSQEIAQYLGRTQKYIRQKYLMYMIKEKLLVHTEHPSSHNVRYVVKENK